MPSLKIKKIKRFVRPYRVTRGEEFRLKDFDPRDTRGLKSEFKGEAKALLESGVEWLADEQQRLYAQDRWGVLLIFQAMDAAGKDGTIKHVMSGVDPQGVQVHSFKSPSNEDLDHDFLWRCAKVLPERGRIGIFNRSYYEEVLVVRVHRQLLENQKLPPELVTRDIWRSVTRRSTRSSAISPATAISSSSSSSTFRRRSRKGASSIASTSRKRTGNTRARTRASASTGTTT